MYPFNPQAVLAYSPASYEASVETGGGNRQTLRLTRRANGNYSLENRIRSQYVEDLLAAQGLPRLGYRPQFSREHVCQMLAALNGQFNPTQPASADFSAFLQAQVDVYHDPQAMAVFQRERDEFERLVLPLLQQVQREVLLLHRVREVHNPFQAFTVSKARMGLFVWPDWRNARYVNVALRGDDYPAEHIKDLVHAWAEQTNLRINPAMGE